MAQTNRGRRDGKQNRPKQSQSVATTRTETLPIVGEVRLVRSSTDGPWTYDPMFLPDLPPGAVRGDITGQIFCCDAPRYAYVDLPRECVQCGTEFVFAATEQKYWYEVLQFRLDSTAIRCQPCRRQRRSDRAVSARFQSAAPFRDGADAGELIEFASALCEMIDRAGTGKPAEVVAAARRTRCTGRRAATASPVETPRPLSCSIDS
jgi:hypothetical protein